MKNKNLILVIVVILTLSINYIQAYKPKNIEQIVGKSITASNGYKLRIIYRESYVHDGGQAVDFDELNKINSLVAHLKQYKFKLTKNQNEDVKSYSILLSSSEVNASSIETMGDIVAMYTIGDRYICIKSKNGRYKIYEVLNGTLDIKYFDNYFETL